MKFLCTLLLGLASTASANPHVAARAALIDEINASPGVLWKAGVNTRFAGREVGASKSLCGVHAHSKAELESKATLATSAEFNATDLPESFDSETNWPECADVIGDIRDQSDCGCCWAFGAASAASDRMCIATNATLKFPLSAQDVCFCGEHQGCNGTLAGERAASGVRVRVALYPVLRYPTRVQPFLEFAHVNHVPLRTLTLLPNTDVHTIPLTHTHTHPSPHLRSLGPPPGGTLYTAWDFIGGAHGRPAGRGVVTGGQFNGTGPLGQGFCSDFSLPHCHHHGPQGADPYPAEGTPGCPKVTTSPTCPTACDASAAAPHTTFAADKYTFVGTVYMYREEAKIQQAIMEQGPVEAAFSVYADFENYVSGIYHHVSGSTLGGHAIRIVGWGVEGGVKYWKVANSWNPNWGEKGYFRILRGTGECGIEDQVTANGPTATWQKDV